MKNNCRPSQLAVDCAVCNPGFLSPPGKKMQVGRLRFADNHENQRTTQTLVPFKSAVFELFFSHLAELPRNIVS